ncbi:MAG: ABC transporter ATP-binding protein [Anaerolineae bacterium]|jgi:ABC-2 type transport system ATP-binding protein|nr:ABC transporter ATP-binding protein [Anaerolineae bacterium]
MNAMIQTEALTKTYGEKSKKPFTALSNLDLAVQEGEIMGFLGPNGAGKTTTIRLLLDFIRPTSGRATIFGKDVREHSVEIHRRIGYLPSELNLWKNETALSIIRYIGKMRGGVDMKYVHQLAEQLEFDVTKRIRAYSTGNKRKIGLILALMNRPDVLILDEPTSGLDPLMQQVFNRMMLDFKAEGKTVFLSSHVLGEVQEICDRVSILRHGKLETVATVQNLTHVDFRWITLTYREPVRIASELANVEGVYDLSVNGNSVKFRMSGEFQPLLDVATRQYVVNMNIKEATLEEAFLAFYGDNGKSNGKATSSIKKSERELEVVK